MRRRTRAWEGSDLPLFRQLRGLICSKSAQRCLQVECAHARSCNERTGTQDDRTQYQQLSFDACCMRCEHIKSNDLKQISTTTRCNSVVKRTLSREQQQRGVDGRAHRMQHKTKKRCSDERADRGTLELHESAGRRVSGSRQSLDLWKER